jgi:hypothetical protein
MPDDLEFLRLRLEAEQRKNAALEAQTEKDALIIAKMAARVNFVINTRNQHSGSVPEWVITTLEGKNPHAELSDDPADLAHLG